MSALIDIHHVSKTYRVKSGGDGFGVLVRGIFFSEWTEHRALRGVSLRLERGECLGFLGPNGAGKSTLIKILCGLQSADEGEVRVLGVNPHRQASGFYRRLAVVFGHKSSLWWDLPLRTSFETACVIHRIEPGIYKARLRELCRALDLNGLLDRPVRVLSLGERVKGEIVMNLLAEPELLLLDEPTIGLDITSKAEIRALLADRRRSGGMGVFLTSHDMGDIEGQVDRIVLLHKGEVRFSGSISKLKSKIQTQRKISLRLQDAAAPKWFLDQNFEAKVGEDGEWLLTCARGREAQVFRQVLARFPDVAGLTVTDPTLEESLRGEFLSYLGEESV